MLTAQAAVPHPHMHTPFRLYKANGAGACTLHRKDGEVLPIFSNFSLKVRHTYGARAQFFPCSLRPQVSFVFHGNQIKLGE